MYGQLLGRNYFRLAEVGGRSSRPAQKVGWRRKSAGAESRPGSEKASRYAEATTCARKARACLGTTSPYIEATTLQERRRVSCDN
jgi:hypothetical protein